MTRNNGIKIPGMVYMLSSFIPWIVYWTLCKSENISGIIIPMIVSMLLITPQIHKKLFNPMDITSLFYFSIASIITLTINPNIFYEKSGFLGYSALAIMALASLAVKKPYTLQVSQRDYPKIYWKDKSFLLINNAITAVWTMIFTANAIMSLLHITLVVPLSSVLILLGMAFSVIFPLKAPAYLVSNEFKQYDWRINVNPQKPKEEHEYDVVIIGSGIGGLSCGALLSKKGYKVLVLEQHHQIGGYCSSFQRKGFIFNTGVGNISGLSEKGVITYLFRKLELKKDDLLVKNRISYIFNGQKINTERSGLVTILYSMFPKEEENINAFFNNAQKAYDECYKDSETYGTPLPPWLIAKVLGKKKILNYPKEHPHFYKWTHKTYKQILDEYFTSENLKSFLCALLGYLGTGAEETPADSALTAIVSYYVHGGYFPKGSAQNLASTLAEVIESSSGQVLANHKVDSIVVNQGKVEGVKVGGSFFKSNVVIASSNAKTTFLKLVKAENLDKTFAEHIKNLKMSPSCFIVFLGVDMDLSDYPTLIENVDEGYSILINSNADPSLSPENKTTITILTKADYHDFPERNTKEYLKKKREISVLLIRKAEKIIPNLSKHIVVQDSATPKTFERYTSMPEGAIYSFSQSINTKRPYFKTPIKGLYLASASTFPGGGIEAVMISGIICANDVCNWK